MFANAFLRKLQKDNRFSCITFHYTQPFYILNRISPDISKRMQEPKRTYPIDEVLPQIQETFRTTKNVILSAPTGAGKTTRVPISLLASEWMTGKKLIMLEPRRLAARRAAEYMAAQLGESVGQAWSIGKEFIKK